MVPVSVGSVIFGFIRYKKNSRCTTRNYRRSMMTPTTQISIFLFFTFFFGLIGRCSPLTVSAVFIDIRYWLVTPRLWSPSVVSDHTKSLDSRHSSSTNAHTCWPRRELLAVLLGRPRPCIYAISRHIVNKKQDRQAEIDIFSHFSFFSGLNSHECQRSGVGKSSPRSAIPLKKNRIFFYKMVL